MIRIEEVYNNIFSKTELADIRRDIHMHPETGNKEFRTLEKVCGLLDSWGVEYKRVLQTGVIATIRGSRPGKCIGLRADMDALSVPEENDLPYKSVVPGTGHMCGHDIHTTILLGAAKFFSSLKGDFSGTVRLIFQPAEEGIGGAKRMIEAGCLEDPHVDHVLGLHVHPYFPAGQIGLRHDTMYAATNSLLFNVRGKSTHAATPESGLDPIVMTCSMISALQTVVSRNTAPSDSVILSFGRISGGTVRNQIPDSVEVAGTIRTLTPQSREKTLNSVKRICENMVHAMGGTVDMQIGSGYDPLINDNGLVDNLRQTAVKILGSENVIMEKSSTTYAEDFAYYAEERPSMFWHLGCMRSDGETGSLHNSRFNPDESCIKTGVMIQAAFALHLLGEEIG